jgi:enoyl-CoA hydratase/carnithine racemase
MTDASVLLDVAEGVATITLNRPDERNRLTAQGMRDLSGAVARAGADPGVRVVVLTGSGSTFCSGADLSATTEGFAGSAPGAYVEALTAILDLDKPTVAKVQGHVAGGGNGFVAACDLAVAVADARFAFSEVRVGVAPAMVAVVCLQVMHRRDAVELMLTGERVDAERALRAGLLTSVVPADGLDAAVAGLVAQLAAGGPEALAVTKQLLRRIPSTGRDEAFAYTAAVSAERFGSAEAREGMTAFLEKRPPAWASR